MIILDKYKCYECSHISIHVIIENGYAHCENCNTKNDVWISNFSLGFVRHIIKKYICIEQDNKYFEGGKERIADWHKDKASKLF